MTVVTLTETSRKAFCPAASVTRMVKKFVPPSPEVGELVSAPSAATFNHAGPTALLKVSVSPASTSVACAATLLL